MSDNEDIDSGPATDAAPVADCGTIPAQEGAAAFHAYSPSAEELTELIPIPCDPMFIEKYQFLAQARVMIAAREDAEQEVALGPVADVDEPTPDEIADITAFFEAPPLWKTIWVAPAVRREIIASRRRRRLELPTTPENGPGNESFVEVLKFMTAIGESHVPLLDVPRVRTMKVAGKFMLAVSDFCALAARLPANIRDSFVNFAVRFIKGRLDEEITEDRLLSVQPGEIQPSNAQIEASLDQRFGPVWARLPYFVGCDRRRVRRDIIQGQRDFANYFYWGRLLFYSGHRGPNSFEDPTRSQFRPFVINTAVEEFTKKIDGAQDGEAGDEDSGSDVERWQANYRAIIRHIVATDIPPPTQ